MGQSSRGNGNGRAVREFNEDSKLPDDEKPVLCGVVISECGNKTPIEGKVHNVLVSMRPNLASKIKCDAGEN